MSTPTKASVVDAACGPLAVTLCYQCTLDVERASDVGSWIRSESQVSEDLAKRTNVVTIVVDSGQCARCASVLAECVGWSSPRFRC